MNVKNILEKFWEWVESVIFWLAILWIIFVLLQVFLEHINLNVFEHIPGVRDITEFLTERKEILILSLLVLVVRLLSDKVIPIIDEINNKISNFIAWFKDFSKFSNNKTVFIELANHPEVWDGFINTYYVVNAPWQLEYNMRSTSLDNMVKIHAKRYCNDKLLKVYYLIFENNPFEKSIDNFVFFVKKVIKLCPEAEKKIKVIFIKNMEAPRYSLYVGEKQNFFTGKETPYSIIYINEVPFTFKDGFPNIVIVSTDEFLNKILRNYIEDLIHGVVTNNQKALQMDIKDFLNFWEKKNVNS